FLYIDYFLHDQIEQLIKTLFPYTTLFRSKDKNRYYVAKILDASDKILEINILDENDMGANTTFKSSKQFTSFVFKDKSIFSKKRSEEHTSELQSRENIV